MVKRRVLGKTRGQVATWPFVGRDLLEFLGFWMNSMQVATWPFVGRDLCRVFPVWWLFDEFLVPERLGVDRGWVRGLVQ